MTPPEQTSAGRHTETDPDLRRLFADLDDNQIQELERTWELAGQVTRDVPSPQVTAAARERFSSCIRSDRVPDSDVLDRSARRPVRRRSSLKRMDKRLLVAAAVLAAAVLLLVLPLRPRTVTVTVPAGTTSEATLPDGSHVTINASSTLTYETGLFADDRSVELKGEALFDVVEDERIFRVETFNAIVTALGTTFNVRATETGRRPSTRVLLESGVVKLASGASPLDPAWLGPGEMSEVIGSERPTPPRRVPVEAETSWVTGAFTMLDQPLFAVTEALERRFGVVITLKPDALGMDTVSIRLPEAPSAELVLGDICGTIACRVVPRQDGFVLEAGS